MTSSITGFAVEYSGISCLALYLVLAGLDILLEQSEMTILTSKNWFEVVKYNMLYTVFFRKLILTHGLLVKRRVSVSWELWVRFQKGAAHKVGCSCQELKPCQLQITTNEIQVEKLQRAEQHKSVRVSHAMGE